MDIRPYEDRDLRRLVELTIDTFGEFYEGHFRPLVGETVFAHQHGAWREDYRAQVPTLHDPAANKYVEVAENEGMLHGYIAWNIDPARRHGEVEILAVDRAHRRAGTGEDLCRHALSEMKSRGVEVVAIGTGGEEFHAPARGLYSSLGFTELPVAVYFKQL
ncbi:MAG: GNAT family N-acetyltransferase [Pseudonocardiales bacterium]|nr:MAG: GNAT family N-acetyltransferase [Pseudonocardiales bacterium]